MNEKKNVGTTLAPPIFLQLFLSPNYSFSIFFVGYNWSVLQKDGYNQEYTQVLLLNYTKIKTLKMDVID